MTTRNSPLGIRVPSELVERADALIPQVGRLPEVAAVSSITRSVVLRVALARGLASLEADTRRET